MALKNPYCCFSKFDIVICHHTASSMSAHRKRGPLLLFSKGILTRNGLWYGVIMGGRGAWSVIRALYPHCDSGGNPRSKTMATKLCRLLRFMLKTRDSTLRAGKTRES